MDIKQQNNADSSASETVSGRVSVIMPCYNAEPYIAEAIDSVLGQTHQDMELVIVDDGSSDKSVDIARGYGERVRLLIQENQGPSYARNKGIRNATGEFIAFLDADDYWEPDFAELMVSALNNSDAVLAYCGWQNIIPDGNSPPPFIPPAYEGQEKRIASLKNAALWPIHAALTRKKALLALDGFNNDLPACEDYDLWLRLTFAEPIVRVEKVLSYYRHHKKLTVSDKRGIDAEYIRRIKKTFIELNPGLVKDIPKATLDDCIDGGFMRRGYQCYWNRELLSARRIFRAALRDRAVSLKDLKYVLPALLPEQLYVALIGLTDRR